MNMCCLDGTDDDHFYDVGDDYYHSAEDDDENLPASHFLGTEWTAIEGTRPIV